MEKLMKNWIFTLTVCILLAVLAVVMILGALMPEKLPIANNILHIVVAVILLFYTIFALFPLVVRYRGAAQAFVIGETALLLLTVVGQACSQFLNIPWFSTLQACAVFGFALWLRCVTETVHAYLLHGTNAEKKIPLWGLCIYIALAAVGVWQMVKPLIKDKHILWAIGAVALICAGIFAYATVQNRRAGGKREKRPKKEKKKGKDKKAPPLLTEGK